MPVQVPPPHLMGQAVCSVASKPSAPAMVPSFLLLSVVSAAAALQACPPGSVPVLEPGQLSASSSFSPWVGPAMGHLHSTEGGGAWCPAFMVTNHSKEWLQVDLQEKMIITGISLQGRWDNGLGKEFSPFVVLEYFDDATDQFITYQDIHEDAVMAANTDTYTVVKVMLDTPVVTHRVRVIPYSHYQRTVCIRMELHGCHADREVDTPWLAYSVVMAVMVLTTVILLLVLSYLAMTVLKTKARMKSQNPAGCEDSGWYLQKPGAAYQDRIKEGNIVEKEILDIYSVPFTLSEDSAYSSPVESPAVQNSYNSVTSDLSTLSSILTDWSTLEESPVDSSSSSSTARLPSFKTFGNIVDIRQLRYLSEEEPQYANII